MMLSETGEILRRAREAALATGQRINARAVCHNAGRPDLAERKEFADTDLEKRVGSRDPPDEEVP